MCVCCGDIHLEGRAARNRAYDGDTIVIRMLGAEHWKLMLQHFQRNYLGLAPLYAAGF
jgi:hypothetical protein